MELEKSGSLTSDYTKKLPKSRQYSTSLNTSWQIDREIMETVTDFILGGSKITADAECGHEIKRCLLFGRKIMTNLDSIFKSINSLVLSFLYGSTFISIHDYWKNHNLTRWTFVGKVISLLFTTLSSLVITFLSKRKCLLIS